MAQLFHWTDRFLTGLDVVDEQHQQLISIINELGEQILNDCFDAASVTATHQHLLDYTGLHFAEEMTQMQQLGVDMRHLQRHAQEHTSFIAEIRQLNVASRLPQDQLHNLVTWLTNWLTYHILGTDQRMAHQIELIQYGLSPAEAFEEDERHQNTESEPLLAALRVLFQTVTERNRHLRIMNKNLDATVRQRTAELEAALTNLEQANQRLQQLSIQDELTGLHNRRFANTMLEQLWVRMRRDGGSLCVLAIDIDKFKPVNDCFGHATGDALLRELARRFKKAVRASDIVCRMGGDEFLIICPETDLEGAAQVARKILATQAPFALNDGQVCWNGNMSIGVSKANTTMTDYHQLLKTADIALYRCKQQGGNNFVVVE